MCIFDFDYVRMMLFLELVDWNINLTRKIRLHTIPEYMGHPSVQSAMYLSETLYCMIKTVEIRKYVHIKI